MQTLSVTQSIVSFTLNSDIQTTLDFPPIFTKVCFSIVHFYFGQNYPISPLQKQLNEWA